MIPLKAVLCAAAGDEIEIDAAIGLQQQRKQNAAAATTTAGLAGLFDNRFIFFRPKIG